MIESVKEYKYLGIIVDDILSYSSHITFTFMHLADAFIQSDLQCIQAIDIFVSTCVLWDSNPQPSRC